MANYWERYLGCSFRQDPIHTIDCGNPATLVYRHGLTSSLLSECRTSQLGYHKIGFLDYGQVTIPGAKY